MLLQVSYILVRFPNSLSRVAWLHIYTGFPGSELLCGTGFDGWNGNLWRHLLAIWALLCGANNIYVMYIFQKIFSRQTNILPLSYNGGYQKSWHINGVYQHMSNLLSLQQICFFPIQWNYKQFNLRIPRGAFCLKGNELKQVAIYCQNYWAGRCDFSNKIGYWHHLFLRQVGLEKHIKWF